MTAAFTSSQAVKGKFYAKIVREFGEGKRRWKSIEIIRKRHPAAAGENFLWISNETRYFITKINIIKYPLTETEYANIYRRV